MAFPVVLKSMQAIEQAASKLDTAGVCSPGILTCINCCACRCRTPTVKIRQTCDQHTEECQTKRSMHGDFSVGKIPDTGYSVATAMQGTPFGQKGELTLVRRPVFAAAIVRDVRVHRNHAWLWYTFVGTALNQIDAS